MESLRAESDRLTFRSWPALSEGWRAQVEVTERLSKTRTIETHYAVREGVTRENGARVFHVRKQRLSWTEPHSEYEVALFRSGVCHCTCPGAVHRHQQIQCRHELMIQRLLAEGVF